MNRNGILKHIDLWAKRLVSDSEVAKKAGISDTAMSQIKSGKYGADEGQMLKKIAVALDYKESDWVVVPSISNYSRIANIFDDAKAESMWFAISNKAGSGKTGTLEDLYNKDTSGSVFFIQAEEWSGRQFLIQIVRKTLGEAATKGKYKTNSEIIQMIADYFNEMQFDNPVLIIDEADKLRPAALRMLIPLYNKTEERLGLIASGTENLEKEIKAGVRLAKKGYDELDSRFGRNFIYLNGITEKECNSICEANGVTDPFIQSEIWTQLDKVEKKTKIRTKTGEKEKTITYAEDLRRLKRIIKRELLKNRNAA